MRVRPVVAATAVTALPGGVSLASAPSQDQISMRYQVFNIDAVQDMLNSYMEANPHVSIEAISVTGVDHQEVATKILATLAAGNPVDVGFACTEVTHLYAGEGLAQPLTSRLMDDAEEFMEYYADTSAALSEAMLYEGDVYQLMDTFNAANMFYKQESAGRGRAGRAGQGLDQGRLLRHGAGHDRHRRLFRLWLGQSLLGQLDAMDLRQ